MRYLQSFNDSLLESMLVESVLYFSPVFREKLQNVDSRISKMLLELEGEDVGSDVTFIDSSKTDLGKVTFMPMNLAIQKLQSAYPETEDSDLQNKPNIEISDLIYNRELDVNSRFGRRYTGLYSPDRNSIKLGKFVNKVFRGAISDVEVEDFVNQFKLASDKFNLEVELVSGNKISEYYKSSSYEEQSGSLFSSCMNDRNYLALYEENPESCQLAIVKRGDKIVSRAILWKVESDNPEIKYYLDRIYTTKEYYNNILSDWADKQGFAKWGRGYVSFKGNDINPEMKVKVKKKDYEVYPYLDTFRRYDYVKGYLYNDSSSYKRGYILTSTHGDKKKNNRTRIQRIGDYFGIGESLD